ncbi:ABC transporter ATP-binding protein [Psychrobacillus sp. FSL W7-1457]|uniref:ABC transporter ATP-binding protein n=1 Tax=unclassified Psychrobacillus TaxID=2636677 RepID=UPI0030F90557
MSYILKTNHLTKVFEGKEVVSSVNMNVRKGEIYGFLGPNGAGKTTVMKMMTNLIKPTNGEIEIFGERLTDQSYEVLKRIGSIIEYPIFYDKLTARETLQLHCDYMGYYNQKEIEQVLDMVSLVNTGDKRVKEFSLGMKQRLGIARAIITKPELLILDEPINGLDPQGIKNMRELFRMLSKEYGITIIVSSHILGEIEQLADTIGVINNGKLIQEISLEQLTRSQTDYIELVVQDIQKTSFLLSEKLHLVNFKLVDDHCIRIYDSTLTPQMISKVLYEHDIEIEAISKKTSTLEDYFLKLVNGGVVNV